MRSGLDFMIWSNEVWMGAVRLGMIGRGFHGGVWYGTMRLGMV